MENGSERRLAFSRRGPMGPRLGKIVTAVVTLFGAAALAGPPLPLRYEISPQDVAAALDSRGLSVSGKEIAMLSDVRSRWARPSLDILSLGRWDDLRTRVGVACRTHGNCLPFYVLVRWPDSRTAEQAVKVFNHGASQGDAGAIVHKDSPADGQVGDLPVPAGDDPAPQPANQQAGAQQAGTREAPPDSSAISARAAATDKVIALKAGTHAMLMIDREQMRIRVSVVCLEDGAVGQKIRVQSLDHRQTYVAEVLDGHSLKGNL